MLRYSSTIGIGGRNSRLSRELAMKQSRAAALLLTLVAVLWSAPSYAQIEQVTIGIEGMT